MIRLLDKDDRWTFVAKRGAKRTYRNPKLPKPHDMVSIHYHDERYNDENLLKDILDQICWDEEWLIEHKAIKRR